MAVQRYVLTLCCTPVAFKSDQVFARGGGEGAEAPTDFHIQGQLLKNFSFQGLYCRLIGFNFAPRKLPLQP